MPESVTRALHVVTNDENKTVIYSDELGIGLDPMLSGLISKVTHNSRSRGVRGLHGCPGYRSGGSSERAGDQ
ncbi:hypothetical protein EVAR_74926_1 [Eumeta japonica]|uniref:Uncharacterized protein n=1 Tax=Eumeta variegata TaxID=151549 RepID=A0A4C1UJU2_EUMVA|nr:hypothetical protein EVAR_74926_1 [Eumeta japonica]